MTIYHPARSLSEVLLFFPVLLAMPEGPHRLVLPPGTPASRRWAKSLREFAAQYFPRRIEVLLSATDPRAALNMAECPSTFSHLGYLHSQALWCGISLPNIPAPWISTPSQPRSGVVISRSLESHNEFFPWERILQEYADGPLTFCGSLEELDAFEQQFPGTPLTWAESGDLVEVASLLTRSELLVSNQCFVAALADGVGVPTILEVSLASPSMLHPRRNVFPSFGGRTFLPKLPVETAGGSWVSSNVSDGIKRMHWPKGYPTGWAYPDPRDSWSLIRGESVEQVQHALSGLLPKTFSAKDIQDEIVRYTVTRFPKDLLPTPDHRGFKKVAAAMAIFGGDFSLVEYFFQPEFGAQRS